MAEQNKRGTEAQLAGLHGLLAQHFSARLTSGEPLAPSELNVIRQFLKDNGIDCVGSENPVIKDITQSLPTFVAPDEENADGDALLN